MNALLNFWTHGRRIERICYVVGAALMTSGVLHAAYLLISGGTWEGPLSVRKAVSFGLSFGLTLISLAWVSTFLRMGERARRVLLGAFAVVSVEEAGLVTLQVWRGRPSHFNTETAIDAAIAVSLAIGGGFIILITLALTVVAFRANPEITRGLTWALRVGFLAFSATMLIGGAMIAQGRILAASEGLQAAYNSAGFLKPAHAVLMHAILVLPALVWLLGLGGRPQSRAVPLAIAGYLLLATPVIIGSILGAGPAVLVGTAAPGAILLTGAGIHALKISLGSAHTMRGAPESSESVLAPHGADPGAPAAFFGAEAEKDARGAADRPRR